MRPRRDVGDSAGSWLPVPEEDLETPEDLEELRAGSLARWTLTRGRLRLRRIAADLRRGGAEAEVGFLADPGRVRPGASLSWNDRVELAGGRVSLARLPPLLADAMGLVRPGRRVPSPRAGTIGASPSLGASAGAIDGGAIRVRSLWSFAGVRPVSGERLAGIGVRVKRASAAFGVAGATRHGSLSIKARSLGVEALAGSEGKALLAEAASRGEGTVLAARWRYRSWSDRRAAAELSATSHEIRMTWRSWASAATRDDGLLELEWNGGRAPVKIRLGAADDIGERYALVDATVAREAGRSFALHGTQRSQGRSASSTTVGARLNLGSHSIVIESTRIRRGAPAWGVALAPSGDVTLRARSKPGLWITARGAAGAGRWKAGYTLERGEDGSGPGPWSGSVWIGRSRD